MLKCTKECILSEMLHIYIRMARYFLQFEKWTKFMFLLNYCKLLARDQQCAEVLLSKFAMFLDKMLWPHVRQWKTIQALKAFFLGESQQYKCVHAEPLPLEWLYYELDDRDYAHGVMVGRHFQIMSWTNKLYSSAGPPPPLPHIANIYVNSSDIAFATTSENLFSANSK